MSVAIVAALAIATISARPCAAVEAKLAADDIPKTSKLVALAAAKFPNLTHAERAMLWFSDLDNIHRGEIAAAGSSAYPNDPSNDPAHADQWDHSRDIRATLIRWMCTDHAAIAQIDPAGLRVLGGRVVGVLNLSYLNVPLSIAIIRCAIAEPIRMEFMVAPTLNLAGSFTSAIQANGMNIHGGVLMGLGFHASDEVNVEDSRIDGGLTFADGHFNHPPQEQVGSWEAPYRTALNAHTVHVGGSIVLCCGFTSDGAVLIGGSTIGADLVCYGGRISNPDNLAFMGSNIDVALNVLMMNSSPFDAFQADGDVNFFSARIGGNLFASDSRFGGARNQVHGLSLAGASIKGTLDWRGARLENGARLDLSTCTVQTLIDDEASWPKSGNRDVDGFSYSVLDPVGAPERLRWLRLQPGFSPQPYRQLAKVLSASGDNVGAIKVLIAEQNLHYARYGLPGRILGGFLRDTIGYGHRPLLAIVWMMLVVMSGSLAVLVGKRAGVMRPTFPENRPASVDRYEKLNPLLYSLDVFLPFVNLHQEHYWWPDADAKGSGVVLGQRIPCAGGWLRIYLWLQIIAGWLLSAIFIAGVTGLIRND